MYDEKINSAIQIINKYNESTLHIQAKKQYLESTPTQIPSPDKFKNDLVLMGGTTEEALSLLSWEDLRDGCKLPLLLAKQIANIFRSPESPTKIKVKDISEEELFKHYAPEKHNNSIGMQLKKLSGGRKCVVFNDDNSVDVKMSARLLRELEDYGERDTVLVNSVRVEVYKIGEIPNKIFVENPLFIGKPLRSDNSCTETDFIWSPKLDVIRTILYLAIRETKELSIRTHVDAVNIIDLVDHQNGENRVRMRYKTASVLYDKLKKTNRLPSMMLEKKLNPNNPFYTEHRTY